MVVTRFSNLYTRATTQDPDPMTDPSPMIIPCDGFQVNRLQEAINACSYPLDVEFREGRGAFLYCEMSEDFYLPGDLDYCDDEQERDDQLQVTAEICTMMKKADIDHLEFRGEGRSWRMYADQSVVFSITAWPETIKAAEAQQKTLAALEGITELALEMGHTIRGMDEAGDHTETWTNDGEYIPDDRFHQAEAVLKELLPVRWNPEVEDEDAGPAPK